MAEVLYNLIMQISQKIKNMDSARRRWVAVALTLFLLSLVGVYAYTHQTSSSLKVCPDAWYVDQMPTITGSSDVRQYLIINGDRKDAKNYDINWIKQHCNIQVQYVN